MPFKIVRNDITKMHVDAIVNAANPTLLGGGGVDGAIHRAAGPRLYEECRTLGGCKTGEAKITRGWNLPAKHVIHTVGPIWQGGEFGEAEFLASCYRSSLLLADKHHLESIAFPLISSGIFGYPRQQAFDIAVSTICAFLETHEMDAYLVIYDAESFRTGRALFHDIAQYIDDRYAATQPDARRPGGAYSAALSSRAAPSAPKPEHFNGREEFFPVQKKASEPKASFEDIEEALKKLIAHTDESFTEMLLRKIDERGMKDSECYKRANIDRKLFSKIRSDRLYKPSKPTALAFAIALEMPLDEANELLKKAGYALSGSSKFDMILEFFISRRIYDIHMINEALFAFDQVLLGG